MFESILSKDVDFRGINLLAAFRLFSEPIILTLS